MSAHHHDHCHTCSAGGNAADPRYRRVLWFALVANTAMFFVEVFGGLESGSQSLLADAVDFAGDAANYALSLTVLSMGRRWRARAALVKGLSMGAFGLFVLARTVWAFMHGEPPEALTMGAIAVLALLVNMSVAAALYAWREGDANMRSVWLCSRNDAISNAAVAVAALGVFGVQAAWPDLLVATIMATLALQAAVSVVGQAWVELQQKERA